MPGTRKLAGKVYDEEEVLKSSEGVCEELAWCCGKKFGKCGVLVSVVVLRAQADAMVGASHCSKQPPRPQRSPSPSLAHC